VHSLWRNLREGTRLYGFQADALSFIEIIVIRAAISAGS